ncbi:MAG: hypothetical protein FWC89_03360 [Defluviitaleaceae bacterium]|nr:hypothetical protein [Defluviitaleaceae bacterium]
MLNFILFFKNGLKKLRIRTWIAIFLMIAMLLITVVPMITNPMRRTSRMACVFVYRKSRYWGKAIFVRMDDYRAWYRLFFIAPTRVMIYGGVMVI